MKFIYAALIAFVILGTIESYPLEALNERKEKHLAYFDMSPPRADYNSIEFHNSNYMPLALEGNPHSRTVSSMKHDSPVYYIRMPPQPYVFVSGIGYVSQPVSQFLDIPVPFVSNGKPNSIYQWSGSFQGFPTEPPSTYPSFTQAKPRPQKPTKKPLTDSTIHKLPGTFTFNGKPEDIFVLRDSYNSLFNDVLQNVYP